MSEPFGYLAAFLSCLKHGNLKRGEIGGGCPGSAGKCFSRCHPALQFFEKPALIGGRLCVQSRCSGTGNGKAGSRELGELIIERGLMAVFKRHLWDESSDWFTVQQ